MSDEENYDEYMMSGEDMSSFEMEVDSEEEESSENQQSMRQEEDVKDDNKMCESWYSTGKAFKCDNQFEKARMWFNKCQGNPQWWFKSLKQVIKCDLIEGKEIEEHLDQLLITINKNREFLGNSYTTGSLERLVDRAVPDLNSHIFFSNDTHHTSVNVSDLIKGLIYLRKFERLGAQLGHRLFQLVIVRKEVYSTWVNVLRGEMIPAERIKTLYKHIHLESYFVLLQLHVKRFCEDNIVELESLQLVVEQVGEFMQESLSVSQLPTITGVCHFGRFLLTWKSTDYYEQSQVVSRCEVELVSCFEDLEVIGGYKKGPSILSQLSLIGLVFCHLLLNDRTKVIPFERDQIKVLESDPLVLSLEGIYRSWTEMDLFGLEKQLVKLQAKFSPWFDGLVVKLCKQCQSNKLWNQIAPTYSCISISDLLSKLQTGDKILLNRDQLLTLLMRSIAKDTAKVFYKLDLVMDYVYFGDEFRVPLRSSERAIISPLAKSSDSEVVTRDEWLNNIANWNRPKHYKNLTAIHFIDHMNAARVNDPQLNTAPVSTTSFLLKLYTISHQDAVDNNNI